MAQKLVLKAYVDAGQAADSTRFDSDEATLASLQASKADQAVVDSAIATLTDRVATGETDVDAIDTRLAAAEGEIAGLGGVPGDIAALDSRLDSVEGDVATLSTSKADQTAVDALETSKADQTAVDAAITTLTDRVATDETDTDALDTRLTAAESDILGLAGVPGDTAALDTRLDTAESSIDSLTTGKADLAFVNTRLASIDTRFDTDEADTATHFADNDAAIADLDSTKADLTYVDSNVSALDLRVSNSEASIDALGAENDVQDDTLTDHTTGIATINAALPLKQDKAGPFEGVVRDFGGAVFSTANPAAGMWNDSVNDDRAALDILVNTTMQPAGGILDLVGVPRIGAPLAIPANVTIRSREGAYLAPDLGVTVTIHGDIAPTMRKIFGGGGAVVFGPASIVAVLYPQWWGAAGDGVANDSKPIAAAVTAANGIASGATVLLVPRVYLWASDLEATVTNSGVWIVMPGSYPGKQFGAASNRGFGIKLGANQSGSIFRFTLDATARNTSGCGVRLAFIGNARAYTVAGACVNVEHSDNFYHDCSYYEVKGRALWTQRTVKSDFESIDVYRCGDVGKPAIDINKIDATNYTQGSTFRRIAAEVCYGDYYLNLAAGILTNKFQNIGCESDDADVPSQIPFVNMACSDNEFGFIHLNRNAGATPKMIVSGSKNQVALLKTNGNHIGDAMSFVAGQQNVFTNIRAELGTAATTAKLVGLDASSTYNQFGSVGINGGNGIDGGTAVGTNIGVITHLNKNSYTVQNIGTNGKVGGIVDAVPASVASAATLPIPDGKDQITVTGTTGITTGISGANWAGRTITLIFTGVLTVTDGSNLRLAGNFVTSANATLVLVGNGTNWFEVSRSVN